MSYAYIAGYRLSQSADLIGDETNGPDLGPFAGYGQPNTPPGTPTPNSTAAGAAVPGSFAPSDNHKQHGGNVVGTPGSGRWTKQWWAPPRRPSDPPITFID